MPEGTKENQPKKRAKQETKMELWQLGIMS
jgi:hypothetical protein